MKCKTDFEVMEEIVNNEPSKIHVVSINNMTTLEVKKDHGRITIAVPLNIFDDLLGNKLVGGLYLMDKEAYLKSKKD